MTTAHGRSHPGAAPAPERWRPPISAALALGFGGLVATAVAAVLLISLDIARRNTEELLQRTAVLWIDGVVQGLDRHLGPARHQVEFLAERLAEGDVAPDDEARLRDLLLGSLAAAPQIAGVAFIRDDLYAVRVGRVGGGVGAETGSWMIEPAFRLALRRGESAEGFAWGDILYLEQLRDSHVTLTMPVRRDGVFHGIVAGAVSISGLSEFLAEPRGVTDARAFILRGRDEVLAHPALAGGPRGLSADKPLPGLGEVGDPVLAALWTPEMGHVGDFLAGTGVTGRMVMAAGESHIVLYREIENYGSVPWLVGVHVPAMEVNAPIRRLAVASMVGGAILVLAVVLALLLGRGLSRPIGRLAAAAGAVGELDFAAARPLPRSLFRELDAAARAYNTMLAGLRWFETYVPRSLVLLLMRRGEADAPASEERAVTVLFTDIVDFTAIAQRLTAPRLAAFLNRHFALLATCIEAEGGTIDKYIGDSIMAFWGAPATQPDHASLACRAALAIAEAVGADNERRQRKGMRPVRLRIGIHSGPAIAGNIGAPGRINYTLVGDTVNIAQRLEQLGKSVDTGADDVIVLTSGATAVIVADRLPLTPLGLRELRGQGEATEVFRLV